MDPPDGPELFPEYVLTNRKSFKDRPPQSQRGILVSWGIVTVLTPADKELHVPRSSLCNVSWTSRETAARRR